MISKTTIRVRYTETDQMGVAHHSSYVSWFEVGRTELLRECGLPYRELEEHGFLLPVLEFQCKYLQSAYYDDPLRIESKLRKRGRASLIIDYQVYRDQTLLAKGFTKHGITDKDGKLVRIPEILKNTLDRADM